jgi:hypothetical protein
LNPAFETNELKKMEAIAANCIIIPNPAWFGYVELDQKIFDGLFRGSISLYLKHLFELHRGEAIELERIVEDTWFEVPADNVDVFNEYLYAKPSPFAEEEIAIKWHARNLKSLAGSGADPTVDEWTSMLFLRTVENSVLNPEPKDGTLFQKWELSEGGTAAKLKYFYLSRSATVRYHTLASLVYELGDRIPLSDLYTFFVEQRLLIKRAPHSEKSKQPKEARKDKGKGKSKGKGDRPASSGWWSYN